MESKLSAAAEAAKAVTGLLNFGVGVSQRHKGRKLLKQIGEAPLESIPQEVMQNQQMAQLAANTGLPSEQYAMAMKNLQRQQMIQLNRANDRRGGLSVLAGGQQASNDALLDLDVSNANARIQNQKTLYGINNNVASWKDKIWQNNINNPWQRKYQYGMGLLGIGNQNFTSGIDTLAASAISASTQDWGKQEKVRPNVRKLPTPTFS